MPKSLFIKKILILVLCLTITACGFHLRGEDSIPMPLRVMYLKTNQPYGEFEAKLKRTFNSIGITLTDSPVNAPIIFEIEQSSLSYSQLSIGTSNQATVYSVVYTVRFGIYDSRDHTLLPAQDISSTSNLTLAANQVLGASNQIDLLSQQLQYDIITRILAILNSEHLRQTLAKHHLKQ